MERRPKKVIEDWHEEETLGHGTFGIVTLWKNQKTQQLLAIKQYRLAPELTERHCERWRQEVDIMCRLSHPNVVSAVPVPSCLDVGSGALPLLAMEYCNGGDLRKEMNHPENCCGLRERHVRALVRQISAAIRYLHSERIIHRDLKPENIVFMDINGTILYKLIDLGYAKELGPNSACSSFVGTLNYLAPELFMGGQYTITVDFWSLGLLTHEAITGQRPFLPNSPPTTWMSHVSKKSFSQICLNLDDDGRAIFSEELSPYNQISEILRRQMEDWLRVLLQWDPKLRGKLGDTDWFEMLEQILERRTVTVFSVEHCQLKHYIPPAQSSMEHLQRWLNTTYGLPPPVQELLLSRGTPLAAVSQLLAPEEEEGTLYLFHKSPAPTQLPTPTFQLPPMVERMFRQPNLTVHYDKQRTSWSHAVHVSNTIQKTFYHLLHAFKIYLMQLVTKNAGLHKSSIEMVKEVDKLVAKSEFFSLSYDVDLKGYQAHAASEGVTAERMVRCWQNATDIVEETHNLAGRSKKLEGEVASVNARTVELQRSPYARMKQHKQLQDSHQKILIIFTELKKKPKELRSQLTDNSEMVGHLREVLEHWNKSIQELYALIRRVSEARTEVERLQPLVGGCHQEATECEQQLQEAQVQRQGNIWKLMSRVIKRVKEGQPARSPQPRMSQDLASLTEENQQLCNQVDSMLTWMVQDQLSTESLQHSLSLPSS